MCTTVHVCARGCTCVSKRLYMCVLYKVLYRWWANDLKENIKIHVLTLLYKEDKILFFANIGGRQKSEAPPQIDKSIMNILTFWIKNLKMIILTF